MAYRKKRMYKSRKPRYSKRKYRMRRKKSNKRMGMFSAGRGTSSCFSLGNDKYINKAMWG